MKKHKILSLLLALVLAFSAAGTAFATSGSWQIPNHGTMRGTSVADMSGSTPRFTITTSISNAAGLYLSNGYEYIYGDNPSGKRVTNDGKEGVHSLTTTISVDYWSIDLTGANCYHIAVIEPNISYVHETTVSFT